MRTIFRLLDSAFRVLKSEGETGFDYIADQSGLASISDVHRLRDACESHLANLTQSEIDEALARVARERQSESPEDYVEDFEPVKGFVYLMENRRNGYVKIGFSKNPKYREATLQSQEPEVRLIRYWSGTTADEQRLQEQFKSKRLRGEWFALSPKDINALFEETGGKLD